jgi:hypothetical protein
MNESGGTQEKIRSIEHERISLAYIFLGRDWSNEMKNRLGDEKKETEMKTINYIAFHFGACDVTRDGAPKQVFTSKKKRCAPGS